MGASLLDNAPADAVQHFVTERLRGVAAIVRHPIRLHDVFWEGTDGGLWHMWEIDGQCGPARTATFSS